MAMKKLSCSALAALLVVALALLIAAAPRAEAVTCNPREMASCASAITSGTAPSSMCCSKMREQRPCLCGYLQNPALRGYVNSPNAKRVVQACRVSFPRC